jgi:mannose-6-phosphate isomerase
MMELKRPLKLEMNRVYRTYRGGAILDKWQGKEHGKDGYYPEEWIGSIVQGRHKVGSSDEGLSEVVLSTDSIYLSSLIQQYPEQMLGRLHLSKYGVTTAILLKALDSCVRLPIQVHPDRGFAREHFNSAFGKAESWYVIGGRRIDNEDPYMLLGFKPGITREIWEGLFLTQDIEGMMSWLHRFYVKPGDVFLIEGGIPHAIGSGCFLLELQEPTDYTLTVERQSPGGRRLSDEEMHQSIGFEKMLDCFKYDGLQREDVMKKWKLQSRRTTRTSKAEELQLISDEDSLYFSMEKIIVTDEYTQYLDSFAVSVVLSGSGSLVWDDQNLDISQSDGLFMPFMLKEVIWKNTKKEPFEIVICYPPK